MPQPLAKRLRQRAEPGEGFAQRAVAFGDEERQAEHAAPGLPFGDDVVALGRGIKRQRQRRVAVFEHDRDFGGRLFGFTEETDRDAAKRRDRHVECHADAAHRAAQHHALAMQVDDAPLMVGRRVGRLETHG